MVTVDIKSVPQMLQKKITFGHTKWLSQKNRIVCDSKVLHTTIHIPDPNYNYEIPEHVLKETHSECFPVRRVRFNDKNHNKTHWITNGILRSINTRNKLYKKLKKTKIDSPNYITNKTNFKKYRNTLNKTITNAKRVYYKEIFNIYKHDMKKTWGVIPETLNRKVKIQFPKQ